MEKKKVVVVTRKLPQAVEIRLQDNYDARITVVIFQEGNLGIVWYN